MCPSVPQHRMPRPFHPGSFNMRIGVPRESAAGERRVALVPESVARLKKSGIEVRVQRGAGTTAFIPDDAYATAGAELVDDAGAVFGDADVICKVQRPSPAEAALVREGALVISLLQPSTSADTLAALNARRVTALALERVPRITRAQSMDILSSQATVAGYKAVLLAAMHTPKLLPMLTTAAGNIPPAKAFVVGAGVAGLMAIATARRPAATTSAASPTPCPGTSPAPATAIRAPTRCSGCATT